MAEQSMEKYTSRFGLSLIIMLLFNSFLVIIKESFGSLMKGMAALTGHHWTTHGIVVVVMFVVLGLIFSNAQPQGKPWLDAKGVMKGVIIAVIIGYLLIVGFYLIVG